MPLIDLKSQMSTFSLHKLTVVLQLFTLLYLPVNFEKSQNRDFFPTSPRLSNRLDCGTNSCKNFLKVAQKNMNNTSKSLPLLLFFVGGIFQPKGMLNPHTPTC